MKKIIRPAALVSVRITISACGRLVNTNLFKVMHYDHVLHIIENMFNIVGVCGCSEVMVALPTRRVILRKVH